MTFKTNRRDNFYEVFLNDEHFAEWITYHPAVGDERAVLALIEHEQRRHEDEVVVRDDERIVVTVGRDETHEKGGVELPKIGDGLMREVDDGWGKFAFTGEVVNQTAHSWKLVFTRPKSRALGGRLHRD